MLGPFLVEIIRIVTILKTGTAGTTILLNTMLTISRLGLIQTQHPPIQTLSVNNGIVVEIYSTQLAVMVEIKATIGTEAVIETTEEDEIKGLIKLLMVVLAILFQLHLSNVEMPQPYSLLKQNGPEKISVTQSVPQ